LPVSEEAEVGENRLLMLVVFSCAGSAEIPELALKFRAAETLPALVALMSCTTTMVTKSPTCRAL